MEFNINYKGGIILGLDNGIIVRSNRRQITRDILPSELVYPWDRKFDKEGVEILYWRKNWGLRNEVIHTFSQYEDSDWEYVIETPTQVFDLIKIITSFMDKEKWEEDGESIWDYDEILPILQQNIINLAVIAAFMKNNPDTYLIFYDSY